MKQQEKKWRCVLFVDKYEEENEEGLKLYKKYFYWDTVTKRFYDNWYYNGQYDAWHI